MWYLKRPYKYCAELLWREAVLALTVRRSIDYSRCFSECLAVGSYATLIDDQKVVAALVDVIAENLFSVQLFSMPTAPPIVVNKDGLHCFQ
jgi:hypothetical protein